MTGTYDETTGMMSMTFAEYTGMVKTILESTQRVILAKKEAAELEVIRVELNKTIAKDSKLCKAADITIASLRQENQRLTNLVDELLHPCPVCDPAYHEALEEEE